LVIGKHIRQFGCDKTIYDPGTICRRWSGKPGALRQWRLSWTGIRGGDQ
jgi:hypothetical protein